MPIPVSLYFNYTNKILKIEKAHANVKQLQSSDDLVIEDTENNCLICKTKKIFTNEFPNSTKFQSWLDIDLFEYEKSLGLPEKVQDVIKEYLLKLMKKKI